MIMIPQAASVLGCERLWLNISATLIFLRFHAGSHLTIRVASWTWNALVCLRLARKENLPRSLALPRFWTQICVHKRGNTRFHQRSNSLRLPALSDPAARACRVWRGFFAAACLVEEEEEQEEAQGTKLELLAGFAGVSNRLCSGF